MNPTKQKNYTELHLEEDYETSKPTITDQTLQPKEGRFHVKYLLALFCLIFIILFFVSVFSVPTVPQITKTNNISQLSEQEDVENNKEQLRKIKEEKVRLKSQYASSQSHFTTLEEDPYRPLIIFSYYETELNRINAVFFINHALHANADFIFVTNGVSDIDSLLPAEAPNIKIIRRNNTCYDLGGIGEILRANDSELVKKYKKFIVLNGSIRGPFLPVYAKNCWSDIFLELINENVKLVGMNYCCIPGTHVQSMIFATDDIGMRILITGNETDTTNLTDHLYANIVPGNPESLNGLSKCYEDKFKAVSAEISLSNLIYRANYTVRVIRTASKASPTYYQDCLNFTELNWDAHPYDSVFVKANENAVFDRKELDKLSDYHDRWDYSSWEACRKHDS